MLCRYSSPAMEPAPSVPSSIARSSASALAGFTRAVTRYRITKILRLSGSSEAARLRAQRSGGASPKPWRRRGHYDGVIPSASLPDGFRIAVGPAHDDGRDATLPILDELETIRRRR